VGTVIRDELSETEVESITLPRELREYILPVGAFDATK
jgi:hypothetical protein